MSLNKPVHRIAVVGTGATGVSWAAYDLGPRLRHGCGRSSAKAKTDVRKYVAEARGTLTGIVLSAGASLGDFGVRLSTPLGSMKTVAYQFAGTLAAAGVKRISAIVGAQLLLVGGEI